MPTSPAAPKLPACTEAARALGQPKRPEAVLNWIDKNHLDLFAETNGARVKLPRLVSDLILATSQLPDVMRFLADEAGQVRGFDGVLTSPGAAPFVPQGDSYWEFGCDRDVRGKFRRELESRTGAVAPTVRSVSTFVFVTPRHFDVPGVFLEDFVETASAGKGWKDVRLIEGGQLKHWLSMASGVAARWARKELNCYPAGVLSLEEYWYEYSHGFDPPLKEEVLLAGRERQAAAVVERLAALQPDRIVVAADSPEEALAFAIAAVRKASPDVRSVLETRSLVVNTPEAARDLRDKVLAYFPDKGAARSVGALASWGPTILAKGRPDTDRNVIQLSRPSRHEFAKALKHPRLSDAQALQMASECGRSVTVLARRASGIDRPPPPWAGEASLLPALLAGGWDAANQHDCELLMLLAGAPSYPEWQAVMQQFLTVEDPPLEQAGTVWKVRAPVDAFVVLGQHLGSHHFERLQSACVTVLGERDGNLDKSGTELMMAEAGVRHSDWLRGGLAMTLLLTATLHAPAGCGPALATSGGPERWVGNVVEGLPGLASDARLLASLQELLPILAEAAPVPFVAALERFVGADPEGVRWLFAERKTFIHVTSHHLSLLHALEVLAWDPSLLPRVGLLLARLAVLDPDPDSKLLNRPLRSLREILLPWLPGTDADVPVRLGALRSIVRVSEAVGWNLCLQLLPEHHAIGDLTVRPRLREAGRYDEGVTWEDTAKVHAAAAAHVLQLAGTDPERCLVLIERLLSFSNEDQAIAVVRVEQCMLQAPPDAKARLWTKLRAVVARHAKFPDAKWALGKERLGALSRLVERFAPEDLVQSAVPWFDDVPPYVTLATEGVEITEALVEERRTAVVRTLLETEGHAGVLRLAEGVRSTWTLAQPLVGLLSTPEAAMSLCKGALACQTDNCRSLARSVSAASVQAYGSGWLELIAKASRDGQAPEDLVDLALGLPDGPGTWDFVASLGDQVDAGYWAARAPWHLQSGDGAVYERAARRYLEVGRPYQALITIEQAKAPSADLVFEALDETRKALNKGPVDDGTMLEYHVQRTLDALRARADVDRGKIAVREFAYLPLLSSPGRPNQNLALFDIMAASPVLFNDALKLVFRAASQEADAGTEVDQGRARAAYNLLEAFQTVPGVTAGNVDGAAMRNWVLDAFRLAAESDRADVGAHYVGKLMAHAPDDPVDKAWPPAPLRDIIEEVASDPFERGLCIGRFNKRGVFSKDIYAGGDDERRLATQARAWAATCAGWPRTHELLSRIAADWDRHAEREDVEAQKRLMRD